MITQVNAQFFSKEIVGFQEFADHFDPFNCFWLLLWVFYIEKICRTVDFKMLEVWIKLVKTDKAGFFQAFYADLHCFWLQTYFFGNIRWLEDLHILWQL